MKVKLASQAENQTFQSFKCDATSCDAVQRQLSEDKDDLASNFLQQLDSTASKTAENLDINAEVPKNARFLYSLEEKLQLGDQITQAKIDQACDSAQKQKVAEQQAASKNDDILQALDETTSVVANTVEISTDEVEEIENELQLLSNLFAQDSAEDYDDYDYIDEDTDETVNDVKQAEPEAKTEPEEPEALVNFASLTQAELEASFGSFKPVHSLNPYMAKLDPCQAITIDQAIVL